MRGPAATGDAFRVSGANANVFDDGVRDYLTGSSGQDLFLADIDSSNSSKRDTIRDKASNESLLDID